MSTLEHMADGVIGAARADATHLNGTRAGLQLRHPTLAADVKVDDFLVHRLS